MTNAQNLTESLHGEPALAAGAVMAVLNLLVVFNLWSPTGDQLSAVNTAVAAVLALLVRQAVTPASRQKEVRSARGTNDHGLA